MKKKSNRKLIRKGLAYLTVLAILLAGVPSSVLASPEEDSPENDMVISLSEENITDATEQEKESGLSETGIENSETETAPGEQEGIQEEEIWNEELVEEEVVQEEMDAVDPSVTVEIPDTETGDFIIRIAGVNLGTGEQIIVPTWSADKQADLIWYTAEKDGLDYVVRSNISAHGYNMGVYNIHVYRKAKNGSMTFLVKTQMEVLPSAEGITAEDTVDGKSICLTLEGLKTYGSEETVEFAVWSDVNGQDDLKWYRAKKTAAETWTYTVQLSNHNGTGKYLIHSYLKTKSGKLYCVKKAEYEVQGPAVQKVTATVTDAGTAKLNVEGISNFASVDAVEYAVWSDENGQDDLKWFAQKPGTTSDYEKEITLSSFKSAGLFHVHVYAKCKDGSLTFLGKTTMNITGPACASFIAEVTGATSFRLTASEVTAPFEINSLVFPVWSKADQSDLVWYTAAKRGSSFTVDSSISKHMDHMGTYQAHLYAKDPSGKMYCIGKTSFAMKYSFSAINAVLDDSKTSASLSLTGLNVTSGIKEISFAVWSKENGQDDLRWYIAKSSSGDWKTEVKLADHKSTGEYLVHCYLTNSDGKGTFLGATSFEVPAGNTQTISLSNVDGNKGTCTVNIETDPSVSDVRLAAWSQSDQKDLFWYFAKKTGEGKFSVEVNISNHKGNYGTYQLHVYSYISSTATLIGTTTADLKPDNLITITDVTEDSYSIVIRGANYNGEAATAVVCPTWSTEGGQDDLIWYQTEKQSDGTYKVTVYRSNHAHDGSYISDVYVKNSAGAQKMAGRVVSPALKAAVREFDEEARAVMRNIIYAVETGGQVYGGHRYDAFTEAYKNSSAETAITIGAGAWFATEAKHLLSLIRDQYPSVFEEYDTAGISNDLDTENWKYYGTNGAGTKTILSGSEKALAIQNIIKTPQGIAVQDSLIDQQMVKYADQARALGVTDLKARLFCANIQHLGGYNAMVRIINYCKNDGDALTMDNLWTNMREREAGSGNYVGSNLYASRHMKVMQWLNAYL